MRLARLAVLPAVVALIWAGAAGAAVGAPVVTNTVATLPAGSLPAALVVDGASNVYTLNSATNSISKVGFDGTLTAAWATFSSTIKPSDLVSTTNGTLYTANAGTGTIGRVMPDGTTNPSFATLPLFSIPLGLVIASDGTLYTANSGSSSVSAINSTGGVSLHASLAPASKPFDLVATSSGEIYTLNQNLTVSRVTASGSVTAAFASLAPGASPVNLVVGSTGHVFVLEAALNQIEEFDATGTRVQTIALPTMGGRIEIDAHDNVFVTLRGTKTIGLIPSGGPLIASIASLTPGADYGPLAVTSASTVFAVGLSQPIISKVDLRARITSAPISTTIELGEELTATATATGYEPLAFSLTGTVPAGVTINRATGVISGRPATADTYHFSVMVSNMFGDSSEQEAVLTVTSPVTPTPTPTPSPTPTPGTGSGPLTGGGSGSAGTGGSGRGGPSTGALANTGTEIALPASIALVLAAAGVATVMTERRRRRRA